MPIGNGAPYDAMLPEQIEHGREYGQHGDLHDSCLSDTGGS
jgi:hypothetical protein